MSCDCHREIDLIQKRVEATPLQPTYKKSQKYSSVKNAASETWHANIFARRGSDGIRNDEKKKVFCRIFFRMVFLFRATWLKSCPGWKVILMAKRKLKRKRKKRKKLKQCQRLLRWYRFLFFANSRMSLQNEKKGGKAESTWLKWLKMKWSRNDFSKPWRVREGIYIEAKTVWKMQSPNSDKCPRASRAGGLIKCYMTCTCISKTKYSGK